MWEIFICKGSHFFAVFPKLKKVKASDNCEAVEDDTTNNITDNNTENTGVASEAVQPETAENETVEATQNIAENNDQVNEAPIDTVESDLPKEEEIMLP